MKLECIFAERIKYRDCILCDGNNPECPNYLSFYSPRDNKTIRPRFTSNLSDIFINQIQSKNYEGVII
jgi:hypothetical protein